MPDVSVRQFSTPNRVFTLRDPATGLVLNLTGFTIKFAVKRDRSDPDTEEVFEVDATIVSASDGTYQLAFGANETSIAVRSYDSELRWWETGGPPTAPDDAEAGTFEVVEALVKTET